MKISDFINHSKHNKVNIAIYDKNNKTIYAGSIGEFKTSIVKDEIYNAEIKMIYPYPLISDLFQVYIDYEVEENGIR